MNLSGTPRWQKWTIGTLLVGTFALVIFIAIQALSTNSSVSAVNSQGDRRDCVTTLSAARRQVFDDVDIYKAHAIQMLSDALLNAQRGIKSTQAQVDAYDANNQKLTAALKMAASLPSLDRLIAHGGRVDGVHYARCPD